MKRPFIPFLSLTRRALLKNMGDTAASHTVPDHPRGWPLSEHELAVWQAAKFHL